MHQNRWLGELWAQVDDRDRAMYAERVAGRTLQEIGDQHGITRERVRQRFLKVDKQVVAAAAVACPDWREQLAKSADEPAVSDEAIAVLLGGNEPAAASILLGAAGFGRPRVWGHVIVDGWWTARPGSLDDVLHEITAAAPLRRDELGNLPVTSHLPEGFPLAEVLEHSRSPLTRGADGSWLRRTARGRDAAYLWMAERGIPCRVKDLAAVLDMKPHAVGESLRRDGRFAQIRPEGTWVLTEWSHPDISPYSNAEEAMIGVLTEEGAMSKERLFARVVERYPVTTWRLQQCLLSDRIGTTSEGLVDLIVRGARPIEEPEPAQPDRVVADPTGNVLGLRLDVDNDVLRGSGIPVPTWLTWKLGLRQAPMSKTFTIIGSDEDVLTVHRRTGGAQISSLRKYAQALGAVRGCTLAVVLRVDDSTARIEHRCPNGACPAHQAL